MYAGASAGLKQGKGRQVGPPVYLLDIMSTSTSRSGFVSHDHEYTNKEISLNEALFLSLPRLFTAALTHSLALVSENVHIITYLVRFFYRRKAACCCAVRSLSLVFVIISTWIYDVLYPSYDMIYFEVSYTSIRQQCFFFFFSESGAALSAQLSSARLPWLGFVKEETEKLYTSIIRTVPFFVVRQAAAALFARVSADSDIIITTALIPGKPVRRTSEYFRSIKYDFIEKG